MDPPGFRRVEEQGGRPFYRTLPQDGRTPRKLCNARMVEEYLESVGRSDVRADLHFDFTRRLKRKSECEQEVHGKKSNLRSDVFNDGEEEVTDKVECSVTEAKKTRRFSLDNLVQSGVQLDDRIRGCIFFSPLNKKKCSWCNQGHNISQK